MKSPASDPISGDGTRPKEVTGRMVLICLVAFFAGVIDQPAESLALTEGQRETQGAFAGKRWR